MIYKFNVLPNGTKTMLKTDRMFKNTIFHKCMNNEDFQNPSLSFVQSKKNY